MDVGEPQGVDEGEPHIHPLQIALASFIRQTSLPFRFPPISFCDFAQGELTVFNTNGVTLISAGGLSQRPKKEKFHLKVTVPDDPRAPAWLDTLTAELAEFTSSLFDIEISELRVLWGLKEGKPPSLISCDGRYIPNCPIFGDYLQDIALFIVFETAQTVEPGKCFSGRGVCIAADMTCHREKVVIQRIKKMATSLQPPDPREFIIYVRRRVAEIYPACLMGRVPVCRSCFSIYAREKMPTSQPPRIVRSTPVAMRPTIPTSFDLIRHPREHRISSSGLTYVQSTSVRTTKLAQNTYHESPFPAFLQHPM
jgi:hypothetical protein